MESAWTVDIDRREARHVTGLVVVFRRIEGGWNGRPTDAAAVAPEHAGQLMREAGDAFMAALREAGRRE